MRGVTDRRGLWVAVFVGYFVLVLAPAAQAYLDPGSGSFIFQAVVGGLLGAAVAVKSFGGRMWSFLTGRSRRHEGDRLPDEVD